MIDNLLKIDSLTKLLDGLSTAQLKETEQWVLLNDKGEIILPLLFEEKPIAGFLDVINEDEFKISSANVSILNIGPNGLLKYKVQFKLSSNLVFLAKKKNCKEFNVISDNGVFLGTIDVFI